MSARLAAASSLLSSPSPLGLPAPALFMEAPGPGFRGSVSNAGSAVSGRSSASLASNGSRAGLSVRVTRPRPAPVTCASAPALQILCGHSQPRAAGLGPPRRRNAAESVGFLGDFSCPSVRPHGDGRAVRGAGTDFPGQALPRGQLPGNVTHTHLPGRPGPGRRCRENPAQCPPPRPSPSSCPGRGGHLRSSHLTSGKTARSPWGLAWHLGRLWDERRSRLPVRRCCFFASRAALARARLPGGARTQRAGGTGSAMSVE